MALPPLPDIIKSHATMWRRMQTANRYGMPNGMLRAEAQKKLDQWWNECEICLAAYKMDKEGR